MYIKNKTPIDLNFQLKKAILAQRVLLYCKLIQILISSVNIVKTAFKKVT